MQDKISYCLVESSRHSDVSIRSCEAYSLVIRQTEIPRCELIIYARSRHYPPRITEKVGSFPSETLGVKYCSDCHASINETFYHQLAGVTKRHCYTHKKYRGMRCQIRSLKGALLLPVFALPEPPIVIRLSRPTSHRR